MYVLRTDSYLSVALGSKFNTTQICVFHCSHSSVIHFINYYSHCYQ